VMACPFGCADGLCTKCAAGDATCNSSGNVVTCGTDGNTVEMTCANGCTNGTCNPCMPNTSRCSDDGNVLACGTDGTESISETCVAGCTVDGAAPRCKYLQPQFLPDICDTPATTDLAVSTNQAINTSLAANCNGGIVNGMCILHY